MFLVTGCLYCALFDLVACTLFVNISSAIQRRTYACYPWDVVFPFSILWILCSSWCSAVLLAEHFWVNMLSLTLTSHGHSWHVYMVWSDIFYYVLSHATSCWMSSLFASSFSCFRFITLFVLLSLSVSPVVIVLCWSRRWWKYVCSE